MQSGGWESRCNTLKSGENEVEAVGVVTVDMGVLIGILGLFVCVAGFYVGRSSATKEFGKWMGSVDTKLDHLTVSNGKVEAKVDNLETNMLLSFKEQKVDFKTEIDRLHQRINNHLRKDHGINTGDNNA